MSIRPAVRNAFAVLMFALLSYLSCPGKEEDAVASPSGSYAAKVVVENYSDGEWLRVKISSMGNGEVLFVTRERWAARHNFVLAWDLSDRLWVNSSDVGVSVYKKASEGWEVIPSPQHYWLDLPPEVAAKMPRLRGQWAELQRRYPRPDDLSVSPNVQVGPR